MPLKLDSRQHFPLTQQTVHLSAQASRVTQVPVSASGRRAKAATTTLPGLPPKITTLVTAVKTKTAEYNLPIFTANQSVDGTCSQEIGNDFPPTTLFELGKCVNLPFSAIINFESFYAGSCKATAADCYILYEQPFGCTYGAAPPL
jgi:hypothetical protein